MGRKRVTTTTVVEDLDEGFDEAPEFDFDDTEETPEDDAAEMHVE